MRSTYLATMILFAIAPTASAAILTSTQSTATSRNAPKQSPIRATLTSEFGVRNVNASWRAKTGPLTLQVDTVADTAQFLDWEFSEPVTVVGTSSTRTYSKITGVVIVPPDFPNPGGTFVTRDQWQERIVIDSATLSTPQFTWSVVVPITGGTPVFRFSSPTQITMADFSVTGSYEVTGPSESIVVPFSVDYRSVPTSPLGAAIQGNANLADGFPFRPGNYSLPFVPDNPVIFEGTVDGVAFRAELSPIAGALIVPEPAAIALGVVGAAGILLRLRRRRSAGLI